MLVRAAAVRKPLKGNSRDGTRPQYHATRRTNDNSLLEVRTFTENCEKTSEYSEIKLR